MYISHDPKSYDFLNFFFLLNLEILKIWQISSLNPKPKKNGGKKISQFYTKINKFQKNSLNFVPKKWQSKEKKKKNIDNSW
jgi:hypothetical protein